MWTILKKRKNILKNFPRKAHKAQGKGESRDLLTFIRAGSSNRESLSLSQEHTSEKSRIRPKGMTIPEKKKRR